MSTSQTKLVLNDKHRSKFAEIGTYKIRLLLSAVKMRIKENKKRKEKETKYKDPCLLFNQNKYQIFSTFLHSLGNKIIPKISKLNFCACMQCCLTNSGLAYKFF